MNSALCTAVVMTTLLISGCEGIRLMTTNINVSCTQGSVPSTSKPSEPDSGAEIKDREELPKTPLKPSPGKMSHAGSVLNQNERESPLQARFVLPVDRSMESSCPTSNKEVAAIPQRTGTWCWAASAETVMRFHDTEEEMNLSQCNIVDTVYNGGDTTAKDEDTPCCLNIWDGNCQENGLPDFAFTRFGFAWKWWDVARKGPLTPEEIKGQICQNGPFIMVLHYTRDGELSGGGHSVVVGDYEEEIDGNFYLWVHDHSSKVETKENEDRVPTPFELWSYDDYVKARWAGETHRHSFDYVQIWPPQ